MFYTANSPLKVSGAQGARSGRAKQGQQQRENRHRRRVVLLALTVYLTCGVSRIVCLSAGVIAVVVYGLYGNAYSHFELGSSRHMHELGKQSSRWSGARFRCAPAEDDSQGGVSFRTTCIASRSRLSACSGGAGHGGLCAQRHRLLLCRRLGGQLPDQVSQAGACCAASLQGEMHACGENAWAWV